MTKYAILSAALVLVGVLGWAIDSQSRIPTVRNAKTNRDYLVCAGGRIEGRTEEIELRCRVLGRVTQILVEDGQNVEKGDILIQLDDAEPQHERALAEAELALARARLDRLTNGARQEERDEAAALVDAKKAQLEAAELAWHRIKILAEKKAVSDREADDQQHLVATLRAELAAAHARLQLIQAPAREDEIAMERAQIDAAAARVELAKVHIERNRLRAPCNGQILKIDVEPGELAAPDTPEPAVVLVDTTQYRVRAFVEEMDAPRIQPGMKVTVCADGMPGRTLQGHVAYSSPRMSRKQCFTDDPAERYDTKTREVWIDLEPSDPLVIGLPVDVVISTTTPKPPASR